MDRALDFFVTGPFTLDANQGQAYNASAGYQVQPLTTQVTTTTVNQQGQPVGQPQTAKVQTTNPSSVFHPGSFINYRGANSNNKFAPLPGTPAEHADIRLSSIVKWSAQYPALRLREQDFAYLRNVGVYPANRLFVLRRFPDASADDLYAMKSAPVSTLVGYVPVDTDSMWAVNFNEEWEESVKKGLVDVINDIIGFKENSAKLPNFNGASNLEQSIATRIGAAFGIVNEERNPIGEPNVVHEAAIRKINYEGIRSGVKFEFNTEYEQKYIAGMDQGVAMLDIINNVIRMATSNSKFVITGSATGQIAGIIKEIQDGNFTAVASRILGQLKDIIAQGVIQLTTAIDKNLAAAADRGREYVESDDKMGQLRKDATAAKDEVKQKFGEFLSEIDRLIKITVNKYREPLRGAIGAMSGHHTAPWHVTMGNPRAPWLSVGNLVVKDAQLDFGTELGYNDLPMRVKVRITLVQGRNLGGQEISQMFNAGKGRVYHDAQTTRREIKVQK